MKRLFGGTVVLMRRLNFERCFLLAQRLRHSRYSL